jgi:ribulose-phosphate 3-epimerase
MIQVSASLLAADLARLGEEVRRAEQAGVNSFHFDVMDGHYAPNLAFSTDHLASLRPHTSLPFNLHLELDNPDYLLENFRPFKADAITVCLDTLNDPFKTFSRIREKEAKVGLSLNPGESLAQMLELLPAIDMLILLGVHPGFGGQGMQAGTIERVAEAVRHRDQLSPQVKVGVDGGVNARNAPGLIKAGADVLIVGTALFKSGNMAEVVKEIKELSVN